MPEQLVPSSISENTQPVISPLYLNDNSNKVEPDSVAGDKSTGSKGFVKKIKDFSKNVADQASGFGTDIANQAKDFGNGVLDSVKDKTLSIKQRQKLEAKAELQVESVDFSNRHSDAITGILNSTFSGNLFDAGVSALWLYNNGTKIDVAKTSFVDRNVYPFKYIYSKNSDGSVDVNSNSDEYANKINKFLDSIEDPTILGFSLKIDMVSSPLFNNLITDFLTKYKTEYEEMIYCSDYLSEFKENISKIFSSPSLDEQFYNNKYKNHYVRSITNLNKLDNRFVDLKDGNEETLEFLLAEDVRMYTTRMIMLYKNLIWSYNSGKKLIPENLLRFNLYIKISEQRNFTLPEEATLYDTVRDGYSRIIYELKDCEFLFDESTVLTNEMNMTNNDVSYSDLKIKIKYRKVNRIFYSKYYGNGANIIGDKFFKPDVNKYMTELENSKFVPKTDLKSKAVSNNIPLKESLSDKLGRLKTNGLLKNTDKDNALTRFGKSIGNKAIKTGATLIDDKVQQIKSDINKSTDFINNNITDFLKGNIFEKTKKLGTLHDYVTVDGRGVNENDNNHQHHYGFDDATKQREITKNNTQYELEQTLAYKKDSTKESLYGKLRQDYVELPNRELNRNDKSNNKMHQYHNVNDPLVSSTNNNVKPINIPNGNVNAVFNSKLDINEPDITKKPILPNINDPDIIPLNIVSKITPPEEITEEVIHNIEDVKESLNNGILTKIVDPEIMSITSKSNITEPAIEVNKLNISIKDPEINSNITKPIITDPNITVSVNKYVITDPSLIADIPTKHTIQEPVINKESLTNIIEDPAIKDIEKLNSEIKEPLDKVKIDMLPNIADNLGNINIPTINVDKSNDLSNINLFKQKWSIKNPPNNPNLKC